MNKPYNYLFKFIIVGDTSVGKSCLLLQYVDKKFRTDHEATIGVEFGAKQMIIKSKVIKIQIWDTAGQESFRSITRSYYRGSIGAILVYDVTRRETFENATIWVNEIKKYGNDNIVIILVANKTDLSDIRKVSEDEAKEMAKQNGLEYIEVCAKQNYKVDEAFQIITEKIYKKIELNQIDLSNEKCGVKLGSKGSFIEDNQQEEKKRQSLCC
ncbi:unnamed protein product (macronuclear) [Paramecium tetraurelia]|uniref:Chromosome undetermined scaffold_12, whole genome shotgun sequence n=2 Tax=Paramecium TaxID=5884 RepID=Q3SD58_PARTE|nr:uncharacterized protein GSPATT00005198001 [Paramecium tetraurelia]CAD8142994.1 unnamed protein product [Paramecium octaurelia]CAI44507.1 rab_C24 [Paramecium tetraurelia]CAK60449.1 unnamed protein product [Paramecium tetraurelia]|eukprot:XP_001427847.1 hypothetical protein (macronuclear) [Paramecium tetraurelia strain d4-2]